jgi:PRC-barrel domain/Domain of unknown function (DUF2382)
MSREKVLVNENLKELNSSGFEIKEGEPDIRGWKVKNDQNQEIGKVDELLFDTDSMRVRYLIIDLNGKPLNLASRDVIIPIGLAELDTTDNIILLPEVTVGHLASLPEYKKGKITIETERAIRNVFAPKGAVNYVDPDYYDPKEFYDNQYFNERRMYETHNVENNNAGDSVIKAENERERTRILTSDDEKKIFREEEGVAATDKERTRGTTDEPVREGSFEPFREGVIEIKEHSEVPVVSKEPRVVEEISVNKEVNERKEKVKDSVRKTEVDVERFKDRDLPDEV